MIFVGVDPGVGGGIAVITDDAAVLEVHRMPETERDVFDILCCAAQHSAAVPGIHAVLERVNAGVFGANKVGRMGVVSAFTFGRGYGALRMALTAARVPFDEVAPIKWQNAMGCRTRGDKNISKRRAQDLFPTVKCTHATSDALLLAEYCRRQHAQSERTADVRS